MPSMIKIPFICIIIIIFSIGVARITNKTAQCQDREYTMPVKPIEDVLKEHTNELMSIPGVVGIAQGLCDSKPCIKVFVIKRTQQLDQKIPNVLEGYPIVVEETGEFRALPEN